MFDILQVLYLQCTVSAFEYIMVIHEMNMSEDFITLFNDSQKESTMNTNSF